MSTPTNLLTLEVGGGNELLEATTQEFDHHEISSGQESTEEIVVISGTLTISP